MLNQDPPDHTRLRKLVTKAFTTKAIDKLRPRIEQLANELIDAVEHEHEMDVIADYAHKLPVHVICDMLGIPEAHRDRFAIQDLGSDTAADYLRKLFFRRLSLPDAHPLLPERANLGGRDGDGSLISLV